MKNSSATLPQLNVFLHNEPVGTLNLLPGEQILFTFHPSYIDNSNRPTLSLAFRDRFTSNLITDVRATRTLAPPFFSNLLPEGPLRDYLAERASVNPNREFFLLWALGKDLPGAITIEPPPGQTTLFTNATKTKKTRQQNAFHFSLAGIQLKFSALLGTKKGLTIPANGMHGSWIIKLPSQKFEGIPENEFSMMTLARKLGMDVPDVQLVLLNKINGLPNDLGTLKGPAFAVRRFDRTPNGPVHTEDFAQVFGVYPHDKYGRASYRNLATVIWRETGTTGMTEFIRRLVFSTLIGNADMHLKNWSLIYPDRHTAQLAPAYDFVSTLPYIPDPELALKIASSKRMADLSLNELSHLIDKAGLPKKLVLDTARETVKRFKDVWKTESKNLPLTSHVVKTIEKHVKTIRLFGEIK